MALDLNQPPVWPSLDEGRYRVQFARLGSLTNTGLQLPVVSPDGRWIASLSCPDPLALEPDATLTGRTIANVSLVIYDTAAPQSPPRVVSTGAAWPVWTKDARTLIAVAYDRQGRCALIVHDVRSGKTQRQEVGLHHIVTPALSPSGARLALAGFDEAPQDARLYVYDLQRKQLAALPPPKDVQWQLMPMWVTEDALLYCARVGGATGLFGAKVSSSAPDALLTKLSLPSDAADVISVQAGVTRPLSPDARWLAAFDTAENRIVMHDLEQGRTTPLDPHSQSGCWADAADARRFVYATDKQLSFTTVPGDAHQLAGRPLLPVWCHPGGRSFLLLAPGQQQWTFDLIRMQVSPAGP